MVKSSKKEKYQKRGEYMSCKNNFEYSQNVFNRYASATKTEVFDVRFIEWLVNDQENSKLYKLLLKDMQIEYDNPSIAEVGKGSLDSITIDNISKSTIITPYLESFTPLNGTDRKSVNYNKMLANKNIIPINFSSILAMDNISRFFTQNPTLEEIALFTKLHQQNSDITIGIYGNIKDYDLESKSILMDQIRKSLLSDYEERATTIDSTYLHVISSKRRVLKK